MAGTVAARLGRVPKSLAALLVLVTIIGCAWALVVPPWQVTDENAHFAYVQTLVENGSPPSAKHKRIYSSEQRLALATVGAEAGRFYPAAAPPNWSESAWRSYLRKVEAKPESRSDGGGASTATNPPLFYLYDAIPYLLDRDGTIFGQLYAMRIWAVLLLDLTALAGWLLAGEVFGRRQSLQLAVGATCALMPMSTFMSTAVNPDALLIPLWTGALWLAARVIRHRAQRRDVLALCAVAACAILTKATSYGLLFPVLAAFGAAWRLTPVADRRSTLVREMKALPVLVIPVVAWILVARADGLAAVNTVGTGPRALAVTLPGFLDYLWQFYLPRLPFMPVAKLQNYLPVFFTWSVQGIGRFGVVSVSLPDWVYSETGLLSPMLAVGVLGIAARVRSRRAFALLLGTAAVVVLVLRAAGQVQYASSLTALAVAGIMLVSLAGLLRRRVWDEREALLLLLCAAVFGLLLLLHASDYLTYARARIGFMEGRYLLPIVAVFALGVALIIARLPAQARPMAVGLTLAALLGLQFVSLATVLHAYYL